MNNILCLLDCHGLVIDQSCHQSCYHVDVIVTTLIRVVTTLMLFRAFSIGVARRVLLCESIASWIVIRS
jgi:hypothetical protein